MNRLLIYLSVIFMLLSSCGNSKKENPFFTEWDTPYGVAPFDQIKPEHFKPAFLAGMEEHKREIDAIINNSDEPTFENTIKAYGHEWRDAFK